MRTRSFICCMLLLSLLMPLAVFASCKCVTKSNGSGGKKGKKVKTVLVLGNSILRHSPKPEIGWYYDWGMAASVKDSDFVHLLIRDIHQIDPLVEVKYKNIADFERNFDTYPLSSLDSLRNPDMLIMKIAENVNDENALNDNFSFYYGRLVEYIAPYQTSIKVIVDGFWVNTYVNAIIADYASGKEYLFVSISDLSLDSTNTAIGLFEHTGIAAHPSNKGMRMIEQRIWSEVKGYFENSK